MSQYLDWKVGDRVVCVDASHWQKADIRVFPELPIEGSAYTIASLFSHRGEIGVTLSEVETRQTEDGRTGGFEARYFRKVNPRKTSISIFTAILNGQRVGEDA